MTARQRYQVTKLCKVRMLPACWDKRFTQGLAAYPESRELSELQRDHLARVWHRYRRQLANNGDWDGSDGESSPAAQEAVPSDPRRMRDAAERPRP